MKNPSNRAEDRVDFEPLWKQTEPAVAQFIARSIKQGQDREDVLQNVVLAALAKFPEFISQYPPGEDVPPFENWVMPIARKEVAKARRKKARDRLVLKPDKELDNLGAVTQEVSPELAARLEALRECLAYLDGRAVEAIDLCYWQGLKGPQIAHSLKLTPVAARHLLSRTRKGLRKGILKELKYQGAPPVTDPIKLIEAYLDEELAPEQTGELIIWLGESADHLRTFVREVHMHRALREILLERKRHNETS